MSEYWISKKKYFCRYCDIYITDDVPSRTQHETGMRHQGNKERFVKSLYKAGEKRKKDEEEERREMKGVEAAAARAYALDVGAGRAGPLSAPASAPPKAAAAPPKKPLNPFTNYTTAEFLGYKDPDAERIQAELEQRRTQGVVGEWEAIPTNHVPSPPALDVNSDVKPHSNAADVLSTGTKREADVLAANGDDENGRAWKLRKKTARLGDIYDPGVIPIKIKAKTNTKEEPIASGASANAGSRDGVVSANEGTEKVANATDVPKWTKIEWKRAAVSDSTSISLPLPDPEPLSALKSELLPVELETPLLKPMSSSEGSSLFKKRKMTSRGAGQGRRAQF